MIRAPLRSWEVRRESSFRAEEGSSTEEVTEKTLARSRLALALHFRRCVSAEVCRKKRFSLPS